MKKKLKNYEKKLLNILDFLARRQNLLLAHNAQLFITFGRSMS